MSRTRRPAVVLAAAAAALVVAGCGASSGRSGAGSGPSSTASTSSGHRVVISDFAFHPSTLTVTVGTKVTFVNDDSTVHTATDAGVFNSGNLGKGQTYTITFDKAGTYHYICSIHQYMHATIVVTAK